MRTSDAELTCLRMLLMINSCCAPDLAWQWERSVTVYVEGGRRTPILYAFRTLSSAPNPRNLSSICSVPDAGAIRCYANFAFFRRDFVIYVTHLGEESIASLFLSHCQQSCVLLKPSTLEIAESRPQVGTRPESMKKSSRIIFTSPTFGGANAHQRLGPHL